ncbi:hypothetical protein GCL60_14860 [Silvanigrella paludirubra]|uniref:Uncharacterized protein n=1 Tax=Silvanigrella paludirubra TaxID=2499159 RepID=A0A6N6VQZ5_9BACT|nr:hypothetical protein [Silvanigrella paludirubra]KAB8037107.1 hypothetical protein GCL60_14860 [Silvanigrella paludirubra]
MTNPFEMLKLKTNINLRRNYFKEFVHQGNDDHNIKINHDFLENYLFNQNRNLTQLQRQAEQEYILSSIEIFALHEAFALAKKYMTSIAIRPTTPVAFMANESGNPTKPQEIKNKTSKFDDTFLHENIEIRDIGSVVHYNPSGHNLSLNDFKKFKKELWKIKREKLNKVFKNRSVTEKIVDYFYCNMNKIENIFYLRTNEYIEENALYQPGGKYSKHVYVEEPFLFLKSKPGQKIYGDHDLFCFAGINGVSPASIENKALLKDLMLSPRFQAQHGGIYYWNPYEEFNKNIKITIMNSHTVGSKDPLVIVTPGFVKACYFDYRKNELVSVWDFPNEKKWLEQTVSGQQYSKI